MKTIELRPSLPQEQGVFDVIEIDPDGNGYTLATFYGQHAERNAAVFATAIGCLIGPPRRNMRRKYDKHNHPSILPHLHD